MEYALQASEDRRLFGAAGADDAFCAEVGRRLLLAQFEFSRWVLRRVEKVSFSSDRRVARRSSIELRVRDDAPLLVPEGHPLAGAGQASGGSAVPGGYWLLPVSVMRRRTLVGLDLRDEYDGSLRMLGLRFTQKLDESMLRAAALLGETDCDGTLPPVVEEYIRRVISGPYPVVEKAKSDYHAWQQARAVGNEAVKKLPDDVAALDAYFDNVLFAAVLERMWHNFSLYVLLSADGPRHRLLQLAFEEQVTWRFQEPHLAPPDYRDANNHDVLTYEPVRSWVNLKDAQPELFGRRTTRIRLLTPSAENCASYHFEFTAPTGLSISSAALLAGRPNHQPGQPGTPPSWDQVDNPGQSVGLHAVEIPNGSLCRAQVDLRIPSRGWLSTLMVSMWAIALVMGTVLWHARLIGTGGEWTVEQRTNIVLLLVTVAAGAVTYVAQAHSSDVVGRMVSGLRILGTAALTIPSMAAVCVVYLHAEPLDNNRNVVMGGLVILTALSMLAVAGTTRAWRFTRADERRIGSVSPWEMSSIGERAAPIPGLLADLFTSAKPPVDRPVPEPLVHPRELFFDNYAQRLGFDHKAIGVASAEGWHETYGWNDSRQARVLQMLGHVPVPLRNPTHCACRHVLNH